MSRLADRRERHIIAAAAITIHAVVLFVHSLAHLRLEIFLSPLGNLYVITVMVIAPIAAGILFWTAFQRTAGWLLLASMFGSLVFSGYCHFIAHSPDHVSQVAWGGWGTVFIFSAVLMALVEAIGCGVASWTLAKVDSTAA